MQLEKRLLGPQGDDGVFFAALREGIIPASSVSRMLMTTSASATGNQQIRPQIDDPVTWCRIRLMGIPEQICDNCTPSAPAAKPR